MKIFTIITLLIFILPLNATRKYELYCDKELLEKSEILLKSQIGVKEAKGKNDGPQVEKYLHSVGLKKGNPYCAAGQYWCFAEAKNYINKPVLIPLPKTGLANAMFDYAERKGKPSDYYANRHDLLVWVKGSSRFGHIERIIDLKNGGWVVTVGFNTSPGNAREGDGVYVRYRHILNPLSLMIVRGIIGFYS